MYLKKILKVPKKVNETFFFQCAKHKCSYFTVMARNVLLIPSKTALHVTDPEENLSLYVSCSFMDKLLCPWHYGHSFPKRR